mmetsp:Transcript_7535/g.11268  ORF Transcript_7535/g.11268 Transcript_7535/m.11268 type:complete len:110 (-) Transcript_7535:256-585(-)
MPLLDSSGNDNGGIPIFTQDGIPGNMPTTCTFCCCCCCLSLVLIPTHPSIGISIPAIKRRRVDLPLADRPTSSITPSSPSPSSSFQVVVVVFDDDADDDNFGDDSDDGV